MEKPSRGFTLVERMVVVVIIGILASLVAVNVIDRLDKAKVLLTVATIAKLEGQVQLFKPDQARYPEQLDDLAHQPPYVEPRKWPENGYLEEVPLDGWERPFHDACP